MPEHVIASWTAAPETYDRNLYSGEQTHFGSWFDYSGTDEHLIEWAEKCARKDPRVRPEIRSGALKLSIRVSDLRDPDRPLLYTLERMLPPVTLPPPEEPRPRAVNYGVEELRRSLQGADGAEVEGGEHTLDDVVSVIEEFNEAATRPQLVMPYKPGTLTRLTVRKRDGSEAHLWQFVYPYSDGYDFRLFWSHEAAWAALREG